MGKSKRTKGNKRTKLNSKTAATTTVDDDQLSSLPDCLLVSILNLLPTKTAVSTSVLSSRWKHLWTQLTHLSFTCPHEWDFETRGSIFMLKLDDFLRAFGNTLNHLTSPTIHKFELIMDIPSHSVDRHFALYKVLVGSLVGLVCSRHPKDFALVLTDLFNFLKIPAGCIFQCESIVSLNMGEWSPHEEIEINLPNLKKLTMSISEGPYMHEELFTKFFKCCPSLEELFLTMLFYKEAPAVKKIICPKLKRLKLTALDYSPKMVKFEFDIDAPKLEILFLNSDSVNTRFCFVNQPCQVNIVDLDIWDITGTQGDAYISFLSYISKAFKALSSVRFLRLNNGYILEHMNNLQEKGLPIFHNLTELRITDTEFLNFDDLFVFLKFCPNLEVLMLYIAEEDYLECNGIWEDPEFEHLSKVRVLELELRNFCAINYYMSFMEYALRNGSSLEKLLFSALPSNSGDYSEDAAMAKEYEVRDKLFSYPRDSSCCEIKFTGKYVTATSICIK